MGANLPTQPYLAFNPHPLRSELYQELHNRPFPVLASPVRVSHIALLTPGVSTLEEHEHLRDLAQRYSVNPPLEGASCYYQSFGEFEVRWEKHTEFSTYTFISPADDHQKFDETSLGLLPQSWLEKMPGTLLIGVHVLVENAPLEATSRETLRQYFEGQRLIGCSSVDDLAVVWTAFRLHSDDFNRVLVLNRGLNGCQTGRMVQRILEIEAYRVMALLSVPTARELGSCVTRMDQELAQLIKLLSDIDDSDNERRLLKYLTALAAEVEKYRADTNYRFAATNAYYELVVKRLNYFHRDEFEGVQSIPEFLERRLTPAIRTCVSVQQRLEDLSRRISRAGELLNTRVDLSLQEQNQRLLVSMNKRSKVQLRMQQTVEGLSVAAISYYLIGLLKYMLAGVDLILPEKSSGLIIAASVPMIVGGVWWMTHRIKTRIMTEK